MNNIQYLRYKHDLRQKDLAEQTGIAKSVISQLETGKKKLTLYYRVKLEKVFGEGSIKEGVD